MNRYLIAAYGFFAYAAFNLVFLYLPGFLLELPLPKTINSASDTPPGAALAVDLGLIALFGFTHSLMAREGFKRRLTRFIPKAAERSTFVLQSTFFLALLIWQWRALPATIWAFDGAGAVLAYLLFGFGLALVLLSTHAIDHMALFGVAQVRRHFHGEPEPEAEFCTPFLYRIVRHPMQAGMIVLLFATPHMTVGHLVFAAAMTAYILIGLYFEERSLIREFGDTYRRYRACVPMLVPRPAVLPEGTFARAPG
ncbi:isoprenylcysteine carboxylmethyltransferase family protein [Afifella sp. IM 167]|uniref:methyltransferase family protein n=1 Tax=Afifella sp. IM 167 TaxID=2033586 RepID=UPI001CCF36F9|nr:isoprenylcysteine carboxylmethyltransferase family protein [Afifella sp. IM 167]MBZ8135314.1 hypothetical protein [Afifella sp. IM 167]